MATPAQIQALVDRIVREFRPQRIILFGSQASGQPRSDSDVDLLVVMDCPGSPLRKAAEILASVHPRSFAIDLMVRTPQDLAWRYEGGDPLVREAIDRGITLYEAAA
jgi:predicted nucleotidyltransferase